MTYPRIWLKFGSRQLGFGGWCLNFQHWSIWSISLYGDIFINFWTSIRQADRICCTFFTASILCSWISIYQRIHLFSLPSLFELPCVLDDYIECFSYPPLFIRGQVPLNLSPCTSGLTVLASLCCDRCNNISLISLQSYRSCLKYRIILDWRRFSWHKGIVFQGNNVGIIWNKASKDTFSWFSEDIYGQGYGNGKKIVTFQELFVHTFFPWWTSKIYP